MFGIFRLASIEYLAVILYKYMKIIDKISLNQHVARDSEIFFTVVLKSLPPIVYICKKSKTFRISSKFVG